MTTPNTPTQWLSRQQGRIAYQVEGAGPLVVLVPGMGDLRSTYRQLTPALTSAGYRVAAIDLRGHGDSDTTFSSVGDAATAGDVLALIEELGGPAVVIGNSMGAGAGVLAETSRPDLVHGLVLVGPFVRDGKMNAIQRVMLRVAMLPLWAAASWRAYLPKLYAGRKPTDFEAHRDAVIASLKLPGHAAAFAATTRISHAESASRIGDVKAPVLIVMGELDPDFPRPADEAAWIAEQTRGEVVLVADAGHYPHSQRPDVVNPAVLQFLAKASSDA